ncbi:MAG: UDP-N-acetylmuramoyl-L-alanine--D-glutamate ligase [Candidatus Electrothrix aestuarii]|uniref:UDP-N-acetylmuramoylalanine--D-glutamate ligase n=1 Tax=Candidatus Electrothrix aestuarii TaxID=3062594 RepID=A0AAU8LZ86_9BACT|nr:UDP-N-acetylmuramoyl-L-alanine--D-glutamate ligase [Candidatus Electrothrix aestuarii]
MIELKAGMKSVVVGLGKSGLAAVRYLHQQGLEVTVSEFREHIPEEEQAVLRQCNANIETGGHRAAFFADADLIVPSPGVPANLPVLAAARTQGVPVVGELALAAGRIQVPVIAVTGSNGKTTVTSLIGHLLRTCGKKVFVGGNIGTPILEYLLEPGDAEVVVLELSSFQLEAAGYFRPNIGLLLNLSPDHIDRHGSFEEYVAAKMQLFACQGRGDTAIIGTDDVLLAAAPPTAGEKLYSFGTQPGCRARVEGKAVRVEPEFGPEGTGELYELAETRLHSRVNLYNAAAAILAIRAFGCNEQDIKAGLTDFQPPQHRMTPVGEINGVRFVNDSKATNVGAVVAALAGFGMGAEKEVILIAGGRNKGGDFDALVPVFRQHVKHVVLIGESAPDLAAVADEAGVGYQFAADMEEAVAMAFAAASPGDTVLLAPACASFDMFRSYEQRGDEFSRCVRGMVERGNIG